MPAVPRAAAKLWRCLGRGPRGWRPACGGGRAMAKEVEPVDRCRRARAPARRLVCRDVATRPQCWRQRPAVAARPGAAPWLNPAVTLGACPLPAACLSQFIIPRPRPSFIDHLPPCMHVCTSRTLCIICTPCLLPRAAAPAVCNEFPPLPPRPSAGGRQHARVLPASQPACLHYAPFPCCCCCCAAGDGCRRWMP